MRNALCIRPAQEADAEAIARLHVKSWHETYTGILPQSMLDGLSVSKRAESWRQVIQRGQRNNRSLVALYEVNDALVGFGACGAQRERELADSGFDCEIYAIYVSKAAQRTGVGRALINTMVRHLVHHGCDALSLWVLEQNYVARQFYEKVGGVVVANKVDARLEGDLEELAYGWRSLEALESMGQHRGG